MSEMTGRMSEEERTNVEKRKRALLYARYIGSADTREERRTEPDERSPAITRKREWGVSSVCDVSVTRTPRQNGATECDVSGLRATRRTCTADTLQTEGVHCLAWKVGKRPFREDDEEGTKASERDSDPEGVRRRAWGVGETERRERFAGVWSWTWGVTKSDGIGEATGCRVATLLRDVTSRN